MQGVLVHQFVVGACLPQEELCHLPEGRGQDPIGSSRMMVEHRGASGRRRVCSVSPPSVAHLSIVGLGGGWLMLCVGSSDRVIPGWRIMNRRDSVHLRGETITASARGQNSLGAARNLPLDSTCNHEIWCSVPAAGTDSLVPLRPGIPHYPSPHCCSLAPWPKGQSPPGARMGMGRP